MSQDDQFLDKVGGAYYSTPEGDSSILFRVKEDYDGAEPSGNSVAAINLLRLASIVTGGKSESYFRTAEHLLVCPLEEILEGKGPVVNPPWAVSAGCCYTSGFSKFCFGLIFSFVC